MLEIKILLSTELKIYLNEYTETFNKVFSTQYTSEFFLTKYSSGFYNNSFHTVAFDNNFIIGSFTVIPYEYHSTKRIILGLGCDAFITESYRNNELLLFKLFKTILPLLKKEKISSIISIPNPKASKYWEIIAKWQTIDYLKIQGIPVNYFNFLPFTLFYIGTIYIGTLFLKILPHKKNMNCVLLSINQAQNRFPPNIYRNIESLFFREVKEGNKSIIYLLNHSNLNLSSFYKSCLKIILRYRNADLLLIGSNQKYPGLFTIPSKILKRKFPIMVYDIDNEFKYAREQFGIRIDLGSFDNR